MNHKIKIILIAAAVLIGAAFGVRILTGQDEEILTVEEKGPAGEEDSRNGEEDSRDGEEASSEPENDGSADPDTADRKRMEPLSDAPEEQTIFVHVCGEVCQPAVYELPQGSRVFEAVGAAGGFTADAAEDYLNLAGILSDGLRVYVPSVSEVEEGNVPAEADGLIGDPGKDPAQGISSGGKVDLNRASAEELMTLPGVGSAKASAIIAYRERNGAFSSIEEIMKVEGIKEGMFRKIRDLITVG